MTFRGLEKVFFTRFSAARKRRTDGVQYVVGRRRAVLDWLGRITVGVAACFSATRGANAGRRDLLTQMTNGLRQMNADKTVPGQHGSFFRLKWGGRWEEDPLYCQAVAFFETSDMTRFAPGEPLDVLHFMLAIVNS